MMYDEKYFSSINYSDYSERLDKYKRLADELDYFLSKSICIIEKNNKILDYGCAWGFLIQGFKDLGYRNITGYDISEYALSKCEERNIVTIKNIDSTYDLGIFLDVLEHMSKEDIIDLFSKTYFKKIIIRIPCASEKNPNEFYLDISKKDPTHINCMTKKGWKNLFKKMGFKYFFPLNLHSIYDSDGVFCALII